MLAEITPRNTFIRSPNHVTSSPQPLPRDLHLPIQCENETASTNGYMNYDHVTTKNTGEVLGAVRVKLETESPTSSLVTSPTTELDATDATVKNENIVDESGDVEITFAAFQKLRGELERAQNELRMRDDECRQLSRVRDEVDLEIEELTASLFEEAHKMVNEANVGRANAEKKLYETQLKLDGLQGEVTALKTLVVASAPNSPKTPTKTSILRKISNASTSSTGGTSRMCSNCDTFVYNTNEINDWTVVDSVSRKEVDPVSFQYFVGWIESGCPLKENDFLAYILKDDIGPCLRFVDETLSKAVYKSVQNDNLAIEPIQSKPKKCSLCYITGNCPYRIRLGDSDLWHPISGACRARIVSVIDFLTFLRYIRQGILKKDINVLYWDMMKHRAEINLARLGMERKVGGKR